ncbi:MAG: translation initiation factor IF-2 N-terminal domain-containing protein, partial [Acidobacteria bacterium]|nr:translation initiation factor IF-2 N-terminal domain-containing protein [Acidobacteriota bacterium]
MSKIRINELARDLEVKPIRILELLPELGVVDKKTHSSSLDDEVADLVRRQFGVEVAPRPAPQPEAEAAVAAGAPQAAPAAERQAAPALASAHVAEGGAETGAGAAGAGPKGSEPAGLLIAEFPSLRPS